jgi:uncharacterized repeat protein (TIGR03847 family)
MSREGYDFGQVELLDAEAIGKPGQRRFRLFAREQGRAAVLWVEREQLAALGDALDQVLAQISGEEVLRPLAQATALEAPGAPPDFPEYPDVEFQVGQLSLGYDDRDNLLILLAAPIKAIDEEEPEERGQMRDPGFAAQFTREQADALSRHIQGILASGRPRCPFCGAPLGSEPHACPKQNGHHPVEIDD